MKEIRLTDKYFLKGGQIYEKRVMEKKLWDILEYLREFYLKDHTKESNER